MSNRTIRGERSMFRAIVILFVLLPGQAAPRGSDSISKLSALERAGAFHVTVIGRVVDSREAAVPGVQILLQANSLVALQHVETGLDGGFAFRDVNSTEPLNLIIVPSSDLIPSAFALHTVSGETVDLGTIHLAVNTVLRGKIELVPREPAVSTEKEGLWVKLEPREGEVGESYNAQLRGNKFTLENIKLTSAILKVMVGGRDGAITFAAPITIKPGQAERYLN